MSEQQQSQQSQQSQPQSQSQEQRSHIPNFAEFLLPFTFVIRPQSQPAQQPPQGTNDQPTQQPPQSTNDQPAQQPPQGTNDQPTSPAAIHFLVYPIYGDEGGEQTPPFIFFAPFFVPQENRKHVSESTMKKLPIIEITQADIDAQATCPICLEAFSLPSNKDDCQKSDETSTDQESSSLPQTLRQMPCKHVFCESCLFQWLKQNNTCPLCRKEIEAEGTPQQPQNEQTAAESGAVHSQEDVTMDDASSSTSTGSNSSSASFSHNNNNNYHHQQAPLRCALESVGCCGESQSNEESPTASPLITLPQCHHRFHASCLRTSLIVEGYSFESPNSRPLDFYCPTCRSPAIIQSDVLKTPSISSSQEQQQLSLPDSDAMEVD